MKQEKEVIKLQKNNLIGSAEIMSFIEGYFLGEGSNISKNINKKTAKITDDKLSYRIINHWEKEGILSDKRPSGKGWRVYSAIDTFWIKIIKELRKFGYPLENIKAIKEDLESFKSEYLDSEMPFLEAFFVLAFHLKEPVNLVAFSDGKYQLATYREYELTSRAGNLDSHILVYLNPLVQAMYPNKDLKTEFINLIELRTDEIFAYMLISAGNYETITIKKKDGKIEFLEATEHIQNEKRITDILKKGTYQDITIKQANGKVVNIIRTNKIKL